jgi:hypothetical protein
MSAEPKDVVHQVAFQCPRCKATLQIQAQPAGSWVRCPKCGKASSAPDTVVRRAPDPIKPKDDALIVGPVPKFAPMPPVEAAIDSALSEPESGGDEEARSDPANPFRVAAGAGFCVAVILGIFSMLENYDAGLVVFGVMGVLCIIPLIRIPPES